MRAWPDGGLEGVDEVEPVLRRAIGEGDFLFIGTTRLPELSGERIDLVNPSGESDEVDD